MKRERPRERAVREAASHLNRGQSLVRLGDRPAALASLRRALELAPSSEEIVVGVTQELIGLGKKDEALQAMQVLHGAAPTLGRYAMLLLAKLLADTKRNDEADAIYGEVMKASPADAMTVRAYASFLVAGKREEEAERLLREGIERDPSAVGLRGMLVHCLERQERIGEAPWRNAGRSWRWSLETRWPRSRW